MIPDPALFLMLVLFGSWVAMDSTSLGQFMLSRPLVAASLGGWIAGEPAEGAKLGLLLEALHLMVLPVGAARYPESGPAAVAGAGVYATGAPSFSALLVTVIFVLLWEQVGGESVRQLRQANTVLVASSNSHLTPDRLERRHFAALGLDCLRGAVLVAAGILLLSLLLGVTTRLWALGEWLPHLLLVAVLAAAVAASVRLFEGTGRARLVLAGAAGALFFLLLR